MLSLTNDHPQSPGWRPANDRCVGHIVVHETVGRDNTARADANPGSDDTLTADIDTITDADRRVASRQLPALERPRCL